MFDYCDQTLAQVPAADLKTCSAHNVYAATVITAITRQNTIVNGYECSLCYD